MYFLVKNTLKNNHNHTPKQINTMLLLEKGLISHLPEVLDGLLFGISCVFYINAL
jgi:hypothetical protein